MSQAIKMRPAEGQDFTPLSLLNGHTFVVKSPSSEVPQMFRKAALEAGCEPVAFSTKEVHEQEPATQIQLIKDAIERILERDISDELTNSGQPKVDVLRKEVGFNVTKEQADAAWGELQNELADPQD